MDYDLFHGDLADHLLACPFPLNAHEVFVGKRPVEDGWVAVALRIDGCASKDQAVWLGDHIQIDLVAYLRHTNQEDVPLEAVQINWAVPEGASTWSVAIYVVLGSAMEADAMADFLTAYAKPALSG